MGSVGLKPDLQNTHMRVSEDRYASGITQLSERRAGMRGWRLPQGRVTDDSLLQYAYPIDSPMGWVCL
ncbi:hypothetical protein GCM10011357_35680 [Lacimicrobium alkaliphilum]|uniref:Uncharacterized protein n=1 Tax=Lacimicrobium alkaliphilum TaxID=1526571 RepID=A0ABQ1RPI8_9ALTE|nr:hypothetical protein GCM10011357_35680 [Lacimicrobium alkaliphilum]